MTAHASVPALPDFTASQLKTIKQTVAKDCNDAEFNMFVEVCRQTRLNPFRRQIYAIVHNKRDEKKRQLTIITGIDGFRSIAARNGNYRPAGPNDITIEYDNAVKSDLNPLGIVKAGYSAWKLTNGEWHPSFGLAYWDEFAPVEEVWDYDQAQNKRVRTGAKKLKDNWRTMGRQMIVKCAEAQALRRGWPEDLSGIYTPEEIERAVTIDGTASEIVEEHDKEMRERLVNANKAIPLQFAAGLAIEMVPDGQVFDRVCKFLRDADSPTQIEVFRDTNREGLRQFWARCKSDALELKHKIEDRVAELEKPGPAGKAA